MFLSILRLDLSVSCLVASGTQTRNLPFSSASPGDLLQLRLQIAPLRSIFCIVCSLR
ncbi:Hypothetical protein, secreted [Salinibacter ruber M8]|uniref:Uncharacterized protein n=1 Tax=Salinibacter ruber (strain M8) TaxID=761659 RepID=D5H669_SALRM|nr:Hypothetical protein, secreted [Salinibacter ruber M8]